MRSGPIIRRDGEHGRLGRLQPPAEVLVEAEVPRWVGRPDGRVGPRRCRTRDCRHGWRAVPDQLDRRAEFFLRTSLATRRLGRQTKLAIATLDAAQKRTEVTSPAGKGDDRLSERNVIFLGSRATCGL